MEKNTPLDKYKIWKKGSILTNIFSHVTIQYYNNTDLSNEHLLNEEIYFLSGFIFFYINYNKHLVVGTKFSKNWNSNFKWSYIINRAKPINPT